MPDRYLGRQIGKYRVTRLLGTGAFAWVFEAIDRDLEIPVALKILRPEFAGDPEAEARFRREAATAARLRHANIVVVRDVGLASGASFVAMDLLPWSVGARLRETSKLSESDVIRIGIDVAAALAVAHGANVIHRDIKPDNILLGADGEAVVADFGLARALASPGAVSAVNTVMGTPHYFSPEQARGRPLDGRSDLYSLGVTLYRAATGRLPFEGDDWYAVGLAHIESEVPAPRLCAPELTQEFEAVVLRLLAKRPDDRYADAAAVSDALLALPNGPRARATSATPLSSTDTISALAPIVIRKPRRRMVTSVIVLGLAALGLWLVDARRPLDDRWFEVGRASFRADSARLATRNVAALSLVDSLTARRDAARVALLDSLLEAQNQTAVGDSQPTSKMVPSNVVPSTARLTLTAADAAILYVDGTRVGAGEWSGERPVSPALKLSAILATASTACGSAHADTVIRLRAGEVREVALSVRPCVALRMSWTPSDARLVFAPLDGGHLLTMRADTSGTVLLPAGRYLLTATSPRCSPYSDTVTTSKDAQNGVIVLQRRMIC